MLGWLAVRVTHFSGGEKLNNEVHEPVLARACLIVKNDFRVGLDLLERLNSNPQ